MKKVLINIMAASALSSLITACANAPTEQATLEGEWILTHAETAKQSITFEELTPNYTLSVNLDGSINGLTACNRWRSSYKVENNKLSIGAVAITKKRCHLASDKLKLITRHFPNALKAPATIKLDHDTLTLSWSDSEYWQLKAKD